MTSQEQFFNLLLVHRRNMGPGNRAKTQNKKPTGTWLFPWAIERKYSKEITRIFSTALDNVSELAQSFIGSTFTKDSTDSELKLIIAEVQKSFTEMFGEDAGTLRAFISQVGYEVSNFNDTQAQKFWKQLLSVEFVLTEAWEIETIAIWADENVSLIKSLSAELIKKLNSTLSSAVLQGYTATAVTSEIQKLKKNMTKARAALIARDQVGKLNGALTKRRMGDAGINYYNWATAGDERVRSTHTAMQGRLCAWGKNTVYFLTTSEERSRGSIGGVVGIPGSPIQCRCTSLPYFVDVIQKVDQQIAKEVKKIL